VLSGDTGSEAELEYEMVEWAQPEGVRLTDALYEEYGLQSIGIPGSHAHPTRLVQSAAMASVAPPKPSYRPHLPPRLVADGVLSDAQIESVIYAGEAHAGFLAGVWKVDETFDLVTAASSCRRPLGVAVPKPKGVCFADSEARRYECLGSTKPLSSQFGSVAHGTKAP
jgi:hypothetical protein